MFSGVLLGVGNTLHTANRPNVRVHSPMIETLCILSSAQIVQCNDKYVAVWKRQGDDGPTIAVASPFAVRNSRGQALEDLRTFGTPSDYGPNVTTRFKCFCAQVTRFNHMYPHVSCALHDTCMLRKDETFYVISVGWVYGYAANTLLAIGSLLLVVAFCGTVILMMDRARNQQPSGNL